MSRLQYVKKGDLIRAAFEGRINLSDDIKQQIERSNIPSSSFLAVQFSLNSPPQVEKFTLISNDNVAADIRERLVSQGMTQTIVTEAFNSLKD